MARHPIPCIDLTPLVEGEFDSPRARAVAERLRDACAGIGFVTVTGHGVDGELVDETRACARAFFSLSNEAKLEVAPKRWNPSSPNVYRGYFPSTVQGKEGLDLGEPRLDASRGDLLSRPYYELNRFPDAADSAWQAIVARYFDALSQLGRLLIRALVATLGGDPDRVDGAFSRPEGLSTLRFNAYPAGGEPVEISRHDGARLACETHVDSGFLTILHHGDRPGLQVRDTRRQWHDVPCDPRAFVVNTGRALQLASGGALKATPHRVLHTTAARLSIPFFFEPAFDFTVRPASLGLPESESKSEASAYEAFLRESLGQFAEYDRREPPTQKR